MTTLTSRNNAMNEKEAAVWAAWAKLDACSPFYEGEAERLRDEYRAACKAAAPLRGEVIPPSGRDTPTYRRPNPEPSSFWLYMDRETGAGIDGFDASAKRMDVLLIGIFAGIGGFLLSLPIMIGTGFPISPLVLLGAPLASMAYGSWRYCLNPNYRSW